MSDYVSCKFNCPLCNGPQEILFFKTTYWTFLHDCSYCKLKFLVEFKNEKLTILDPRISLKHLQDKNQGVKDLLEKAYGLGYSAKK